MIFGMSTACFFPHIYNEDAIDLMGKMGIENIEVFFSCISEYDKGFVAELKRRADTCGINIKSIHAFSLQFEPQLFSRHERARREALDVYQRVLEAGAVLGADTYVFHGPANVKRAKSLVLDYEYVASCTDPIAQMASSFGIKLAWENVHWCWYEKPDFPERLLPLLTTDNLYFTLDVKQAVQAGFSPVDYVYGMQGRLVNIHICDIRHDETLGVIPMLPFHGDLSFEHLKKCLHETGYDAMMILEVYSNNYKDHTELADNFHQVKDFFIF